MGIAARAKEPGPDEVDAVVVGGGPAGLSCAIYLARYNRSVVVLDGGEGRSTWPQRNHNYLGFPGGVPARELRRLGREQLAPYEHVQVVDARVSEVAGDLASGFSATAEDGRSWSGRVLVLATGVVDEFPRFPGWESFVGRSLFWCLTCDGWESRGRDVVVVGDHDQAAGEALQMLSLTDRVRLLTNSPGDRLSDPVRQQLERLGIPVLHGEVVEARGADGQLECVVTADGLEVALEVMFSVQGETPRSALAVSLGLEHCERGYVVVDTEQKTSVPGVYAAGDLTQLHAHQISAAVHEGAQAASAANFALYPSELITG